MLREEKDYYNTNPQKCHITSARDVKFAESLCSSIAREYLYKATKQICVKATQEPEPHTRCYTLLIFVL